MFPGTYSDLQKPAGRLGEQGRDFVCSFGPLEFRVVPGERGAAAQFARQLTAHGSWSNLLKRIWVQVPCEVVFHGPPVLSSALFGMHSVSSYRIFGPRCLRINGVSS